MLESKVNKSNDITYVERYFETTIELSFDKYHFNLKTVVVNTIMNYYHSEDRL